MKRVDCKIVQDLLPNYIEKLTNKETNQYIEEHLNFCKECQDILSNMKNDIEIDSKKRDKREVKYVKKYQNKLRTLKVTILLILLALILSLVIITGRKIYIISSLSAKAEECIAKTNFYSISYLYDKDKYQKIEVYNMGDKRKVTRTVFDDNGDLFVIKMYGTKIKDTGLYLMNMYTETKERNTVLMNYKEGLASFELTNALKTDSFSELLKASMFSKIQRGVSDYKDCYYISNYHTANSLMSAGYFGMYVSKENGLLISTLPFERKDGESSFIACPLMYHSYEFDSVTEEDFIEPDISQYEILK